MAFRLKVLAGFATLIMAQFWTKITMKFKGSESARINKNVKECDSDDYFDEEPLHIA